MSIYLFGVLGLNVTGAIGHDECDAKGSCGQMTHSFGELVADHLQTIADALRDPKPNPAPRPNSDDPPQSERLADPRAQAILPAANVDNLMGGSHFVEDEINEPGIYYVFVRHETWDPFRFRAALHTDVQFPQFVEDAYVTLLERSADEAGRGNYVMMLREGYLRPIEFLKTLASSDEFLNRSTRVLVVPDTSQWLPRLSTSVEALEIRTATDL